MIRGDRICIPTGLVACLFLALPLGAQGDRGKAELQTAAGSITIDYGRPQLRGRDMLSQQQIGEVWRMGKDQATVLKTPADLLFGTTRIAKGAYSIWLKRVSADGYELVFNSETGQWGTSHEPSKDVVKVSLKKGTNDVAVETFTISLKDGGKGGLFSMSWGKLMLSADFEVK